MMHLCLTPKCRNVVSRPGAQLCEECDPAPVSRPRPSNVLRCCSELARGSRDTRALQDRIEATLRDRCSSRSLDDAGDRHVTAIILAKAIAKSLRQDD